MEDSELTKMVAEDCEAGIIFPFLHVSLLCQTSLGIGKINALNNSRLLLFLARFHIKIWLRVVE